MPLMRAGLVAVPFPRFGLIGNLEPGARDAEQMGALDRRRALRVAQAFLRILPVTSSAGHSNSSGNDATIGGKTIRGCGANSGMRVSLTNFCKPLPESHMHSGIPCELAFRSLKY